MENRKCTRGDCQNKLYARGLCDSHYRQDLADDPEYRVAHACSVDGCDRTSRIKGMCSKHYYKLYKSGTLERLVFGPEWRRKMSAPRNGSVGLIDPTRDPRPGKAGYYAVNIVNEIRQGALEKKGTSDRTAKRASGWWALTGEQAYRLIVAPCFYCGIKPDWPRGRNGIDRKECSIGYTPENCVSACWQCNAAKNTHSLDAFRAWLERAYLHFVKGTG